MLYICPHCNKDFRTDAKMGNTISCPLCSNEIELKENVDNSSTLGPQQGEITVEKSKNHISSEDKLSAEVVTENKNPHSASDHTNNRTAFNFDDNDQNYQCQWDLGSKDNYIEDLWDTFKTVLFKPSIFFKAIAVNTGYHRAYIFALIMFYLTIGATAAYQMGMFTSMSTFQYNPFDFIYSYVHAIPPVLAIGMILFGLIVIVPILAFIGFAVRAAIIHVCLMIVGGKTQSFEVTMRVVLYASAPVALGVIPILGGFVGGIWNIVLEIVGIKTVHNTSYARAIIAYILPMLLCCCLGVGLSFIIGGALFSSLIG